MAEGYKDWSAGEILTAADLEDYTVKQSVMRFADSSARTTALSGVLAEGMMSYLKDTNTVEVYDGSSWAAVAGGKILQVVRATDTTQRTITATSFVDASISVTITPTSATSDILLVWTFYADFTNLYGAFQITDAANTAISGAELNVMGVVNTANRNFNTGTLVAYDSPATTSATTYKGRAYAASANAVYIRNQDATGQLFALEISA
jgi:hypothetical protein